MDEETIDLMEKFADNAFECSTKFTKRAVTLLSNYMFFGWLVTVVWLVILTLYVTNL